MSSIILKNKYNTDCPIEYALMIISGKWKIQILHALVKESPKRFKILERELIGITSTMLTTQLRELENDGMITRQIFASVPPTVEYSLTETGKTVGPMIQEIKKWGIYHRSLKKL